MVKEGLLKKGFSLVIDGVGSIAVRFGQYWFVRKRPILYWQDGS